MSSEFLMRLYRSKPSRALLRSLGVPTPVTLNRRPATPPGSQPPITLLPTTTTSTTLTDQLTKQGIATTQAPGSNAPGRVLIDATAVQTPGDITPLVTQTLQPLLPHLPHNSRLLFTINGHSTTNPHLAAAHEGIAGLVRSLSKELGLQGTTVNLLRLSSSPNDAAWPLAFFLSPESAYVTGQEITLATPSWKRDGGGGGRRVALVTGASRGLGAATVRRLGGEGVTVVGVDVPSPQIQADLAGVVGPVGGMAVEEDITAPGAPDRLVGLLREKFGGVDIVVHNAGITRDKTCKRMRPEHFSQVLEVNFTAMLRLNEALLGLSPSGGGGNDSSVVRPGGRVVLMSSINGIAGAYGQTNYAASKAALIGYAHCLAPILAKRGITINCLAPGYIETSMVTTIPFALRVVVGTLSNALKQGGLPEDVAACVSFLAGEGADAVTGQTLRVCGGNLVGR